MLTNNTTIKFNNNISRNFKIDVENINPGESKNFFINLKPSIDGKYLLKTSITNYQGELFNYISLLICCNQENVNEGMKLKEYVEKSFNNEIYFVKDEIKSIEYIYYIDSKYGNEIENLFISFDLKIELTKVINL